MSSAGSKRPRGDEDNLPYGSDTSESYRSSKRRDGFSRSASHSKLDQAPRDWRDAHLNHRPSSARDRYSSRDDRRYDSARDRERRDYYHERDGRRPYEPSRDKPYGRGGRYSEVSRDGYRDYHTDGHRDRSRDSRSRYNSRSRSRSASLRVETAPSEGKEEGEISPRIAKLALDSPANPSTPRHQPKSNSIVSIVVTPETAQSPAEEEEPEEELSPEQIIAQRRARRQAILAKYNSTASTPSGGPLETHTNTTSPIEQSAVQEPENSAQKRSPSVENKKDEQTGDGTPLQESRDDFSLLKVEGDDTNTNGAAAGDPSEQFSAADYDPNLDRREDEEKRIKNQISEPAANGDQAMDMDEEEEVEDEEDDLDDMFALDKPKKTKKVKRSGTQPLALRTATTVDTASDPDGYYQIILGEAIDGGRYQVFSTLGKGMFSAVVRARVVTGPDTGREVAIKIMRSQESMYKAGLKEVQILNKLATADPEDKKHLIRLERTFEHRGHLCLVFESMSMNLREVIKRFGKDVGLNIKAVRAYAHQLLIALMHMKKCNIMHADIKPDNILVNESKALLKLCDLGSASDVSENDITPYLVSRFYRAPEIILGLPYDTALDMWSIGCTLYELYTGKILFPGKTNNHMLLLMMELRGRFNSKMIKKAKFGDVHFEENGAFNSVESDKITGKDVTRTIYVQKATHDLRARLITPAIAKANNEETKMLQSFVDLLEKCLNLDPAKRLTPKEALVHPFIRG
ncbi:U4/U6 small nuclear ribonucleoprotein prp4 [Tulasnella sp. 419]|nr:U4/U6 small nuclear ribonucleoprotein prp4 [Tulasnella sp. 419]